MVGVSLNDHPTNYDERINRFILESDIATKAIVYQQTIDGSNLR